ncbi:hypothetical protein [Sphingorhabdus sp.]|uniref:hypothetical protein n=1 Tax=Sphingorhabdus sp. TaxID=1902408 RepID=UPI0035945BED
MNTESKANAAFTSIMLRGGRVTKWKGQVASCAPQVGHLQNVSVAAMAAALAFGGAMAIPSDALAQDVPVVVNSPSPAPEIVAVNSGDGALIINATVPVEGANNGINAENESTATNLIITATDVQGDNFGIFANNAGTGTTTITTTGNVVGLANTGINVNNAATAGATARGDEDALTVDVNSVTGATFGISAVNSGAGSTRITTSGDVTGTSAAGINVFTSGRLADDLIVEANGIVTGGTNGIQTSNNGVGSTTIDANANVEGAVTGINAVNGSTAANLFITATDVQGGEDGIFADNAGTGTTFIETTGNVVGLAGGGGAGIEVLNRASAGALARADALTVDANSVTGDAFGISVTNFGAGSTRVTTSGNVTGTNNVGIRVSRRAGTSRQAWLSKWRSKRAVGQVHRQGLPRTPGIEGFGRG